MTFFKKPLALLIPLVLAACSTDHIASNQEHETKYSQMSSQIDREFTYNTDRLRDMPFEYSEGFYVLGGSFEMVERQSLPAIFDTPSSFNRVDEMTIDSVIDMLNKRYQPYGLVINLDNEARSYIADALGEEQSSGEAMTSSDDSTGIIPIATIDTTSLTSSTQKRGYKLNFNLQNASLRQALDLITANTNTWWKYEDGRATIFRFNKETFQLDTGDRSFQATFTQNSSSGTDDNTVGAGLSSEGEDAKPLQQIEDQIKLLLSEDGEVYVNRFDKTATIKDTPPSLKVIRDFLENHNMRATTSYGITAHVFEIVTEVNDERGIDWEAAFQTGSSNLSLTSPNFVPSPNSGGLDLSLTMGNWDISSVFSTLNNNASIYSYIKQSAKTKNNIPTIVSSIDDRGIVAGRSVTVNSEGFAQESIETKLIDEGFAVSTRPRLTSKGLIDLEVIVNTKVIKDVTSFGNADNEVQLEENRRQNTMGFVVMRDGQHTIVNAYERLLTAADVSQLAEQFPWWAGGNQTKRRYKSNLIVVVQPTILEI
ncbi:hypothetical protein [Vibrio agarivorans]|uniref:hypothetical protein n=1 Tax=Vibrio agarivorans TaxID=153622 RepID=UPI0025B3EE8E|nr:hypothetical protein [Vibrio agarivorans]MDN3661081.1 hypothetical protein [Vibrio agarivorans]